AEEGVIAAEAAGGDAGGGASARAVGPPRCSLGEQGRVVKGQRTQEGTEADPARVRREPRERGPGVERRALGIAEEAGEVVRAEERLEAAVLRGAGEPAPALPREPFLSLDHEAEADRHRGFSDHRRP